MTKIFPLAIFLAFTLDACAEVETKPDERLQPNTVDCYTKDGLHIEKSPDNLLILIYTLSDGWVMVDPKAHCFK